MTGREAAMSDGLNVTGRASRNSRPDCGGEWARERRREPPRGRSPRCEIPQCGRGCDALSPAGPERVFAFRSSRDSTGSALRMSQRSEDTGLERRTRRVSHLAWRTDMSCRRHEIRGGSSSPPDSGPSRHPSHSTWRSATPTSLPATSPTPSGASLTPHATWLIRPTNSASP